MATLATETFSMTIDGSAAETARTIDVRNPATGGVFAQAPDASADDLDRAVAAATAAFERWKTTPIDERKAALNKAAGIIEAHAKDLAALFVKEQGRPYPGAKAEILGGAMWMKATTMLDVPVEVTEDSDTRRVEVHHVPLGVVCGIVPWNFPVLLAVWKIAPALLAGNTLVLKPSPFTPLTTLRIGELIRDCFPAGVFNVISGGDALGPLMTAHKGFAKITFTGSTATGKRVMESAAKDLKRITLELGGNDAAIVLPTDMVGRPPVETVATALSNGWCWSIPLRHRVGNGYVYSRDFQSPDAAETELRRTLGVSDAVEARHLTFRVGQVARHWERNCVAIGLSQGFIEPLEATALHLVLGTVEQFIRHYREGDCTDRHRAAFNTVAAERMDGVRDYIVAHYKLNTRTDTDYWRVNAANEALSDPLLHILDRWFRRGDVAEELARQGQRSHFGTLSWHCLLAGYGAFPPVSEPQRDDMDFHAARQVGAFLDGCALNFAPA